VQVVATYTAMMPRGDALLSIAVRAILKRHLNNLFAPQGS
jgi:hypothetical protein